MSNCHPNVFSKEFLGAITEHFDYPILLQESETVGPWNVTRRERTVRTEWILKMDSEPEPFGVLNFHEAAFMLAAVLPAAGRSPIFKVGDSGGRDWRLSIPFGQRGAIDLGTVTHPDDFLRPLHTAHSLLQSADSLAWLLMAAQSNTLERAGALVIRRLHQLSER